MGDDEPSKKGRKGKELLASCYVTELSQSVPKRTERKQERGRAFISGDPIAIGVLSTPHC